MLSRWLARVEAWLNTPFGHVVEHFVTAGATAFIGIILVAYKEHGTVTIPDVEAAWAAGVGAFLFAVRTWLRNRPTS